MTDAEIAQAWIDEISKNDGIVDPNRNGTVAFVLSDLISSDPDRAWAVIRQISNSHMTSWAESNFSAGPLTSLVYYHSIRFAEEIRQLCLDSPKFHDFLLGVVFQDIVSDILNGEGEGHRF